MEGIFGSHLNNTRTYYKNDYSNSGHEAIEFGGIKKTFDADIKSITGICYALRCKKATGDPRGGPLTDFPRATDNSLLCAYRYERGGSFLRNSLDSHLLEISILLAMNLGGILKLPFPIKLRLVSFLLLVMLSRLFNLPIR